MRRILSLLLTGICLWSELSYADISQRTDVKQFINEMSAQHAYDRQVLQQLFREVTISESILAAIAKPAEKLLWYKYRQLFVTPKRVSAGVSFWRKHAHILRRAEQQFGVPAEIIVAIIGVETAYGRNTGRHKVLDALSTLAFAYPKRSNFFRQELIQFLLLTRTHKLHPLRIRGSYAGAMGIPQFIASSYSNYAIDFNSDGQINLLSDPTDAIGSVANYLHQHGWRVGDGIVQSASLSTQGYKAIIDKQLKPNVRAGDLAKYGIDNPLSNQEELVKLFAFQGKHAMQYWLAQHNFYVITRYNHSKLYAMAVYQLSVQIKQQYQQ